MPTKEDMARSDVIMAELRAEMRGLSGKSDMFRLIFGLYAGIILLFLTQIFGG